MRHGIAAVLPPPNTELVIEDVGIQDFRARSGARDIALHLELGQRDPQGAAEQRGPGAGGAQHGRGADRAVFRYHARHLAARSFEPAYRAGSQDSRACSHRRACDRGCRLVRLGAPVARGVQRARPAGSAGDLCIELATRDDTRIEPERLRGVDPRGISLELRLLARHEQAAALGEADILADFRFKTAPDAHALDHHRQFPQIAALLPNPAPVPPGLLARDVAFLAHHHVNALLRKEPGGGDPDNAAADDYDAGARRASLRRLERFAPGL